MSETISRKLAIDALDKCPCGGKDENGNPWIYKENAVEAIEMVEPSPEPQIIRCKDCKHHWTYKCMDSMPIERCDLEQTFYDAERDFCSLAERRTDGQAR